MAKGLILHMERAFLAVIVRYMPSAQSVVFKVQSLSTADFWIKICVLLSLSLPQIILGGIVYKWASGMDWTTSLFTVYGVLYRIPGVTITRESTTAATIVLNVLFLFGIFVFAILLGMITEEIKRQVERVRSGERHLVLKNHILILGWNQCMPALLRQLAAAHKDPHNIFRHKQVVILAPEGKAHMDALVSDAVRGSSLKVHTRSGATYKMGHLSQVSASLASTVILLHPDSTPDCHAAEALKAMTALALTSSGGWVAQRVVVQVTGKVPAEIHHLDGLCASAGGSMQLVELLDRSIVDKLQAQAALQPGVGVVVRDLLRQGRGVVQFRWHGLASPCAQSYAEVRRSFGDAVVVGYVESGSHKLHTNPDDGEQLQPGSRVLALTRQGFLRPNPLWQATYKAAAQQALHRQALEPRCCVSCRVVVAGWHADEVADLVAAVAAFAGKGTKVTALCRGEIDLSDLDCGSCTVHVQGCKYPTSSAALLQAGIADAAALVLGSSQEGLRPNEADAHVVAAMLQVMRALSECERASRLHVVAKVASSNIRLVVDRFFASLPPSQRPFTYELLIAEELTAAVLTQVAQDHDFAQVVEELLSRPEGNELYLLPADRLGLLPGQQLRFADVVETARLQQQTALGLVRSGGEVSLAPAADSLVELREGDKVVVLAEEPEGGV